MFINSDSMLPVKLPSNVDLNVKVILWIIRKNGSTEFDGKKLVRETDTLDIFVCSSWYYLRFCSPKETNYGFNQEIDYWMPVDQYIGGRTRNITFIIL